MTDLINSGSGNSSTGGDNPLKDSPFGPLSEVLSDEDFSNIFSGLGNGEGSGTPFASNPFEGDNFWKIFAGGVNPSAVGEGSPRDPLTGVGNQSSSISTTEIPNGFSLRLTIDNLIDLRLNEKLGDNLIPFDVSKIPSFSDGKIPFDVSKIPSFGDGQIPFDVSKIPSFGGGQIPFDVSKIPSFSDGQIPFDVSKIPSFGDGQITFP